MASQIVVRPWNRRRDRSTIGRWPAANLPAHWAATGWRPGPRESWAIDADGELVGRISLREFCGEFGAKLGIYLHPERYGQGIGTEAMRQFLAIAPVEYINLDVAADNQRAIRCYQKVGFQSVTASNPVIMLVATRLGRERMEERYASFAVTMSHAFSSAVR